MSKALDLLATSEFWRVDPWLVPEIGSPRLSIEALFVNQFLFTP
jgi:hypothetical protein